MLELASVGEDLMQGGSMVPTEVASQVVDPGVVDSPSAVDPPLKLARMGPSEEERRTTE
jgi:hypothetical protein